MLVQISPSIPRMPPIMKYPSNLILCRGWIDGSDFIRRYGNIFQLRHRAVITFHESLFGNNDFLTHWEEIIRENNNTTPTISQEIDGVELYKSIIDVFKDVLQNDFKINVTDYAVRKIRESVNYFISSLEGYIKRNELSYQTIVKIYESGMRHNITPKHITYIKTDTLPSIFPLIVSFGQINFIANRVIPEKLEDTIAYLIAQDNYETLRGGIDPVGEIINKFWKKFLHWDSPSIIKERSKKYETQVKENVTVTVGADPELEFFTTKKLKTGKIIPDFQSGAVSAHGIIQDEGYNQKLGLDGNVRIAELRPTASNDSTKVAKDVKKLMRSLSSQITKKKQNIVAVASGGFWQPTGGHIHLGHPLLKIILHSEQCINQLLKMLDTFLYYPLKQSNPFATRGWSRLTEIDKIFNIEPGSRPGNDTMPSRIITPSEEIISKVMAKANGDSAIYSSYDQSSAVREQNWGIEYRSLPSFICDYQLTRLVLKIAQKITEQFISAAINNRVIKYNNPPTVEDYCKYITPKEYETFMRYITGDKKGLFAESVLKNWRIKVVSYPSRLILEIIPIGDQSEEFAAEAMEVIKSLEKFKEYDARILGKESRTISIQFCQISSEENTGPKEMFSIIDNTLLYSTTNDYGSIRNFLMAYTNLYSSDIEITPPSTYSLKPVKKIVTFVPIILDCVCFDCVNSYIHEYGGNDFYRDIGLFAIDTHRFIDSILAHDMPKSGLTYRIRDVNLGLVRDHRVSDINALEKMELLS